MIGAADLHKAINTVWDDESLDSQFTALWPSSVDADEFQVLNDTEAGPAQPMPYCVFEVAPGEIVERMSGHGNTKRVIRDVEVEFRVHARKISGDDRTAKEIAADLAEEVMKVYGGHPDPDNTPVVPTLDNGNFLIAQYQSDFGIRTGDNEHMWTVQYLCRLDVPVAIGA